MSSPASKTVKLKDDTEVVVRSMTVDDLERSWAFFQGLPAKDRAYLRCDVSNRDVVEKRTRALKTNRVKRLVAVVDDDIVAEGALEQEGLGWKEHVSELRLIVARPYQRKGLGMLLARELFTLAASLRVEEIIVKVMRPQLPARRIFRTLGFHEEILMPEYVKDLEGQKQDLILARCDLEALWQELEDYFATSDWQRVR